MPIARDAVLNARSCGTSGLPGRRYRPHGRVRGGADNLPPLLPPTSQDPRSFPPRRNHPLPVLLQRPLLPRDRAPAQEIRCVEHASLPQPAYSDNPGPIVRIQPNEIHLSDQQHFETIYHVGSKYTKSPVYYGALCIPNATHTAASNEIHKRKRARLNPMFSRKMVLELEDVVHDKANKVIALTYAGIATKQPVDLHHAFRCVSVDVITEYAFDKSYDLLDSPDLGAHFFRMVRGLGPAMYFFQQFPSMRDVALKVPPSVAYYMGGAMRQVTTLQMVRSACLMSRLLAT